MSSTLRQFCFCFGVLIGCSRGSAPGKAPASDAASAEADVVSHRAAPLEQARLGTIRGRVQLLPDAAVPLGPDPQKLAALAASSGSCPPLDANDRRVLEMDESRGLSPVHVAVTGMTSVEKRAPVTHELYIDGCRLTPTLIATVRGDRVKLVNRSEETFVPVISGEAFGTALAFKGSKEFEVDYLGTRSVLCKLGNYCGTTFVVGLAHPLQAVTDRAGSFEIEGVPLGQELSVHAWHPQLIVASEAFTLTAEAPEKELVLTIKPVASQAAAPPQRPVRRQNGVPKPKK